LTDEPGLRTGPTATIAPASTVGESAPVAPLVVPQMPSRPLAAMGWMIFACFLFAVMGLCAKHAAREVSFLEVATGRAWFGALTIYAFARARGARLAVSDRRTQWARTIAGTLSMIFGFYALARLPLGDAVTISNLSPLMIAVASYKILGEKAGAALIVAVLLGLAGVALLAGAQFSAAGLGTPASKDLILALVCGVLGAFFSCVAMLYLRRLGARESAEGVSLHFLAWAGLVTLVLGIRDLRVPSFVSVLALAGAGVAGGLAQVVMTRAYGLDKAARVGAFGYSGVVISQALGALFLREIPSARQLAGAGLVVSSGLVLVSSGRKER
jgi:drug/metabolite transporter (DMT)-like permease